MWIAHRRVLSCVQLPDQGMESIPGRQASDRLAIDASTGTQTVGDQLRHVDKPLTLRERFSFIHVLHLPLKTEITPCVPARRSKDRRRDRDRRLNGNNWPHRQRDLLGRPNAARLHRMRFAPGAFSSRRCAGLNARRFAVPIFAVEVF